MAKKKKEETEDLDMAAAMAQESDENLDMAAAMGVNSDPMSQDDINKLMGDFETKEKTFNSVIENIIYMSMLNYERLPMLDVIVDRFILDLTTAMKANTSSNTDIVLKSLEYKSYHKAISSLPMPGILSVCNAEQWTGQFLFGVDAPLLYSSLEIMLGGRKSKPAPAEGRSFTSIERKIAGKLANIALSELKESFSPLTDIDFDIDRIETNPQFATVAQPNSACVHVILNIAIEGRKGQVDIIIPYSTLEPVRKLLSKVFLGERLGGDPIWEKHLKHEVLSSQVKLQSVFHEIKMNLNQVMNLKVGDTLNLDVSDQKLAKVSCDNMPMFTAKFGKTNKTQLALRVEKDLGNKERMINDIQSN